MYEKNDNIVLYSSGPSQNPFFSPPHSLCHKPLKMIRPAILLDKYRYCWGAGFFFSGAGTEI